MKANCFGKRKISCTIIKKNILMVLKIKWVFQAEITYFGEKDLHFFKKLLHKDRICEVKKASVEALHFLLQVRR